MITPTAAYQLFHYPILVEIQNKYLYRVGKGGHAFRLLGCYTGDPEQDERFMNDWTAVERVPVGIIQLWDEGIKVRFVNTEDMVRVYQWLKEHIDGWAKEISKPFGAIAPKKDLVLMDQFAEHISHTVLEYLYNAQLLKPEESKADALENFFTRYKGKLSGGLKPMISQKVIPELGIHSTELVNALETSQTWRRFNGGS